jgi:predicted dehydrogenase
MTHPLTRRRFVQSAVAGSAALTLPAWAADPPPASERLTLGFIGVGTMGRGHLGAFLGHPGVQVVAVCDVVAARRDDAQKRVDEHYSKQQKKDVKVCAAVTDFRDLLARKDIDAVVIATPDHWHAIPCVLAAQAGKHIYCEKPLTHNLAEGRALVNAVQKAGVTFQTGSQQRNEFGGKFRYAVDLIKAGRLGKLKTVRIGVGGPNRPCDLPEQPVPEGTDWNLWLGPAPQRPFHAELCPLGIHKHFPAWRQYREYAGGGLADMGAHHFDIAQWALGMDDSGPVQIVPPSDPKAQTGLKFVYANGVEMFHGGPTDCLFEGEAGTIAVSRGKFEIKPEKLVLPDDSIKMINRDHRREWIECIRTKKQPTCTAEIGHRSASICHLGNIGYIVRKPLKWDPVKEQFDDADANKLLRREARAPWPTLG